MLIVNSTPIVISVAASLNMTLYSPAKISIIIHKNESTSRTRFTLLDPPHEGTKHHPMPPRTLRTTSSRQKPDFHPYYQNPGSTQPQHQDLTKKRDSPVQPRLVTSSSSTAKFSTKPQGIGFSAQVISSSTGPITALKV